MSIKVLPDYVTDNYEIREYKHALSILRYDFPEEFNDIMEILQMFKLKKSAILAPGGAKSEISGFLDSQFYKKKWDEKMFETKIVIDDEVYETPTHKVDCYKNRIALDIEWNNKTEFYDRDLNNYRLLHDRGAISLAVMIVRSSSLDSVFKELGKYPSYGASTTHMDKLIPRIEGGSGGGCPIVVFGITERLYDEDI